MSKLAGEGQLMPPESDYVPLCDHSGGLCRGCGRNFRGATDEACRFCGKKEECRHSARLLGDGPVEPSPPESGELPDLLLDGTRTKGSALHGVLVLRGISQRAQHGFFVGYIGDWRKLDGGSTTISIVWPDQIDRSTLPPAKAGEDAGRPKSRDYAVVEALEEMAREGDTQEVDMRPKYAEAGEDAGGKGTSLDRPTDDELFRAGAGAATSTEEREAVALYAIRWERGRARRSTPEPASEEPARPEPLSDAQRINRIYHDAYGASRPIDHGRAHVCGVMAVFNAGREHERKRPMPRDRDEVYAAIEGLLGECGETFLCASGNSITLHFGDGAPLPMPTVEEWEALEQCVVEFYVGRVGSRGTVKTHESAREALRKLNAMAARLPAEPTASAEGHRS